MDAIPYRIGGIPCLIEVTRYNRVKPWRGSPHTCPSSNDYFGYEEVEYNICDRKGYKAEWLEKKVTDQIAFEITSTISDYMRSEA